MKKKRLRDILKQNRKGLQLNDETGTPKYISEEEILVTRKNLDAPKRQWYLRPRFVTPVLACLLITIFFFTPTGKTFAKNIYYTVYSWINPGTIRIEHGEGAHSDEEPPIIKEYTFDSFGKLHAQYRGYAFAENHDAKLINIIVSDDGTSIIMSAEYEIDGSPYWIGQTIYLTETSIGSELDFDEDTFIDVTFGNDFRALGIYGEAYSFATAYYENVTIEFVAENTSKAAFETFIKQTEYK